MPSFTIAMIDSESLSFTTQHIKQGANILSQDHFPINVLFWARQTLQKDGGGFYSEIALQVEKSNATWKRRQEHTAYSFKSQLV